MLKLRKILVPVMLLIGAIQFIPYERPVFEPEAEEAAFRTEDAAVNNILNKACMDCHSDHPRYPWYANVVPFNYLLENHIMEGREHLNFSEWNALPTKDREHAIKEIVEVMEKKEMPLASYWLVHWDAKLTDAERATLIAYFKNL